MNQLQKDALLNKAHVLIGAIDEKFDSLNKAEIRALDLSLEATFKIVCRRGAKC
jgi:hypothetical protein